MKYKYRNSLIVCFVLATMLFGACAGNDNHQPGNDSKDSLPQSSSSDTNAVANALPFTISFEEQTFSNQPALPAIQSFVSGTTSDGKILIIGGRSQGLHTFKGAPDTNFLPQQSNNFIYLIDPNSGGYYSFNVDSLPSALSAPLQSTNMQACIDRASGTMYIAGGYGWLADKSNMTTFNSLISFPVDQMAKLIAQKKPAKEVASIMKLGTDNRFAVTGGELFLLDGKFYLVFGQVFQGQYRAFGGNDFKQKYTQEVRTFTLKPGTNTILAYGAIQSNDDSLSFHRRDGNTFHDIDPTTGMPRITAYGGVFKQGIIAPYDYPVYINGPSNPVVDFTPRQKFSQYECPVVTVYDSAGASVYHSFFGGIGHYYYTQTASQKAAYDTVTKEGRNDGFPFVEDISCFVQRADGSFGEYILPQPIVNNRLLGASTEFIVDPGIIRNNIAYSNGVIRLKSLPAGKTLVGYVYGGIEAQNPLPLAPNTGTFVSNSFFKVYLSPSASAAIPASKAKEAVKNDANIHRQ